MAAAIPEGLEPLGVWDAGSIRDLTPEQHVEVCRWHERYIGRLNDTYRVEFHDGPPRALVYRFAVNADGRKYQDGEDIAREEPVIVPLAGLPPERLLRTA